MATTSTNDERKDMSKLRKPERGEKKKLIENLLSTHPDKKNKELVAIFNTQAEAMGIEMTVREDAQEIASVRSALKKAGETGTGTASKPPATSSKGKSKPATTELPSDVSGTDLLAAKALADQVGGLEKLKAAITLLEQLQG